MRTLIHPLIVLAASLSPVCAYDFTNIPKSVSYDAQHAFGKPTEARNGTTGLDSVLYNVSSLGLPDPFAHYSTHLTYDSKVEIGDPHNNQKGSILTLLNGTIYPMGSVGAIGAIGWEGDSNDTDVDLEQTTRTKSGSVKKNSMGGMSGAWCVDCLSWSPLQPTHLSASAPIQASGLPLPPRTPSPAAIRSTITR